MSPFAARGGCLFRGDLKRLISCRATTQKLLIVCLHVQCGSLGGSASLVESLTNGLGKFKLNLACDERQRANIVTLLRCIVFNSNQPIG